MPDVPAKRSGRPPAKVYTLAEVSALLDLDERWVKARARLSFFPGAWEDESEGWLFPDRAVKHALRCAVQPLYDLKDCADLLGVSYFYLFRQTQAVADLSVPLMPGKKLRAMQLFLGEGKPLLRVPECELERLAPSIKPRRKAA